MLNQKFIFPLFLVCYEVLVYLSTDMYLPALPKMREAFTLNTQETQTALTLWFLGSGVFQWAMGPISDRFGRRPILLASAIIYILTCFTCFYTKNYAVFLFARFIQGAMIGPIFVGGYAAIHEKFKDNEAVKILAVMSCITIAAPTLGPVLGAMLLKFTSWQGLFLCLGLAASCTTLGLYLSMPETIKDKCSLAPKALANSYAKCLRSCKFTMPILTNCCTFAGMIAWLTMGAFIAHAQGLSEHGFGYLQLIIFGAYILGNRIIPLALKKFTQVQIVSFGLYFGIGFGTLLFSIYMLKHSFAIAIVTIAGMTFGAGMCGPNLQRIAMDQSSEPMGLKLAIYSTLISLSGALVSFIVSLTHSTAVNVILAILANLIIALTILNIWKIKCQKS